MGIKNLAAKTVRSGLSLLKVDPVCEWVHFVDGPDSPRIICGKPAAGVISGVECGGTTSSCSDCLATSEGWYCAACGNRHTTEYRFAPRWLH